MHGDTVTEVLNYVQFHASDLLATFRRKVSEREGPVAGRRPTRFIADYVAGLEGYTYLEGDVARSRGRRHCHPERSEGSSTRSPMTARIPRFARG